MGQLEKYGLYVLCLVIFLILGVTIWGEPAAATRKAQDDSVAIRANPVGGSRVGGQSHREASTVGNPMDLDSLLRPRPLPRPVTTGRQEEVKASPAVGEDASGKVVNAVVASPTEKVAQLGAKTRKYKIRSGDILGTIAKRQLGSSRYASRIVDLNPGLNPKSLQIGQEILLPAGAEVVAKQPASTSSYRLYTIRPRDSFERIARVQLGDRSRVQELLAMNPNVDPRRLLPGKKIKLPRK